MAQDLDAIIVGQTGKIYTAPVGTAPPADTTTAWAVGWVDLATISEDGLTMSFNEDTSEIKQWGGGTVRKMITSSETTFAFTCLESSKQVIETFYRTSIDTGAIEIKGGVRDERAWGIDVLDGDTHIRIVIARGELSERGDVVFKADQAAGYEFTVTAYQDADGVAATMMSDIANWSAVTMAAAAGEPTPPPTPVNKTANTGANA
jgi:hypothetical protein